MGLQTDYYAYFKEWLSQTADALTGDLVAARGGSAPTTYPADDAVGSPAYVDLSGLSPHLIEIENLDATNYLTVHLDDGTASYSYLLVGTGGTDGIFCKAKTAGVAGNSLQVEILVAGLGTALTVTETTSKLTINSATDGAGAATSTPKEIAAAVAAMNSGAGSALMDVIAYGASAVSAAAAASLAGGAAAGAACRKLKVDYANTHYHGYTHRIPAGEKMAFTVKTAVQGVCLKANTGAVVYQLRAYAR